MNPSPASYSAIIQSAQQSRRRRKALLALLTLGTFDVPQCCRVWVRIQGSGYQVLSSHLLLLDEPFFPSRSGADKPNAPTLPSLDAALDLAGRYVEYLTTAPTAQEVAAWRDFYITQAGVIPQQRERVLLYLEALIDLLNDPSLPAQPVHERFCAIDVIAMIEGPERSKMPERFSIPMRVALEREQAAARASSDESAAGFTVTGPDGKNRRAPPTEEAEIIAQEDARESEVMGRLADEAETHRFDNVDPVERMRRGLDCIEEAKSFLIDARSAFDDAVGASPGWKEFHAALDTITAALSPVLKQVEEITPGEFLADVIRREDEHHDLRD